MLITEAYREQQKALHAKGNYGVASAAYAPKVGALIEKFEANTVLDYGAGSKLTLIRTISEQRLAKRKFTYIPYEPAVEQYSKPPEPADLVVCLDVLEHIEPDCLDDVLDDLKRVTAKAGFFTIATGPAAKILPDGRNAHLIQEPAQWWLPRLTDRFTLQSFQNGHDCFVVLVSPLEP